MSNINLEKVNFAGVLSVLVIDANKDWQAKDITNMGDLTVTNLITAGNVDGRDVSADGTKLDGIESGATEDQTKADIDGLGLSHDSLADVSTSDHHVKYTDADAIAAIVAENPLSLENGLSLLDDKKFMLGTGGDFEIYVSSDELYIDPITENKPIHIRYNDYGTTADAIGIYGSGGAGKARIRMGANCPASAELLTVKGIAAQDGIRVVDNTNDAQYARLEVGAGVGYISATSNITMQPNLTSVGWFGISNAFSMYRDKRFHFSEAGGSGCAFVYDSTHQDTNITTFRLLLDDFTTGLEDKTMIFLITGYGDLTYSFGHQPQLNPTVIIHSSNRTQDEWISLAHDQTDGILAVGTGKIKITEPQCVGDYYSNDGTQGHTGTFTEHGGATVTVKNGIITSVV